MSNSFYPVISLRNSTIEKRFIRCLFLFVGLTIFIQPVWGWYRIGEGCLLLILYGYFTKRHLIDNQIVIYDQKTGWQIQQAGTVVSFQQAHIVCQLSWLLVVRFSDERRAKIVPIYSDQLSSTMLHQLCLTIRR